MPNSGCCIQCREKQEELHRQKARIHIQLRSADLHFVLLLMNKICIFLNYLQSRSQGLACDHMKVYPGCLAIGQAAYQYANS